MCVGSRTDASASDRILTREAALSPVSISRLPDRYTNVGGRVATTRDSQPAMKITRNVKEATQPARAHVGWRRPVQTCRHAVGKELRKYSIHLFIFSCFRHMRLECASNNLCSCFLLTSSERMRTRCPLHHLDVWKCACVPMTTAGRQITHMRSFVNVYTSQVCSYFGSKNKGNFCVDSGTSSGQNRDNQKSLMDTLTWLYSNFFHTILFLKSHIAHNAFITWTSN